MLKKRIQAFVHAGSGLRLLLEEEPNFRIHTVAAIGVVVLGFICRLSPWEWVAITLSIGLVMTAEAFNSALENLCDHVSPAWHINIKKTKDMAAAAVLLCAIAAVVVAAMVFLPKVIAMFWV